MSVIVPARNAEKTLPALIMALRAQDVSVPYEVLVVDDRSHDATPAMVAAAGPPFILVEQEDPRGAGAARNRGAAAATGRVLAFTDADCAPAQSWLREGLRALNDADLVQGCVLPDPDEKIGPYDRFLTVTHERGYYETANVLVTRELFNAIGGFEDWLRAIGGRPQGEDTLFGWRARRHGARVRFAEDAVVYHAVIPQSRRDWIIDRWRWQAFPGLVARVPELRSQTLYRRWFFEHRTAAFDCALVGIAAALAVRRVLPLVLTVRYMSLVFEESARAGGAERVVYPAARLAADTVSFAALAAGSIRARELVL